VRDVVITMGEKLTLFLLHNGECKALTTSPVMLLSVSPPHPTPLPSFLASLSPFLLEMEKKRLRCDEYAFTIDVDICIYINTYVSIYIF